MIRMIESAKLVRLLTCTYVLLDAIRISSMASTENSDNSNDNFEWSLEPMEKGMDRTPTTLSCLLFSEWGCDAECYAVNMAYNLFSTGTCNEDYTCECTYVPYTTFFDLWGKKYGYFMNTNHDIFLKIQNNQHVYETLLANPLQTGSQIKEMLKPHLSEDQYDKLYAPQYITPMGLFARDGHPILANIDAYVEDFLPGAIEASEERISYADYKTALHTAFKNSRHDVERRQKLMLEIRRVRNESLNAILNAHLIPNERIPTDNPDDIPSANYIAYSVINNLVNRVENSSIKRLGNWFVRKLKEMITSNCSKENSDDEKTRFQLPADIDRKALARERPPIGHTWICECYKIRYWKGESGDTQLVWVKKSMRVAIRRTENSDISQYWNFRNVKIIMSKTADGDIRQFWNFGADTYQYHKKTGENTATEKWSRENADVKSLDDYKAYIDEWCQNNDILIDTDNCIIYK